jgi:serine/threonine protein kinase
MATHTTSVRDYCTLLGKSKLLLSDEVESLYRRWKDETRGGDDQVDSFRKFLVSKRHLTEYQAVMIGRGHADGFFLNEYRILDRIGKGQMGGVYKAARGNDPPVALKILSSKKAKDPHVLGRFQREARLLTQLDHPNVVKAFHVGDADGVHYIVMEHLEGETLDEVLSRRKKLPPGEAVRLVYQALGGLQHLHERRMIHRDLKPANLMLTPEVASGKPDTTWDVTVKLLDIGLGREMFDENATGEQMPTQLTQEGAVLGTPDYLSPEQAKDARSADARADIYSIGCVLYHCLTGRPPFPDGNLMTQMLKHATEKPIPIAAYCPTAPDGLQKVLDEMTEKEPDLRFQTAEDAAAALAPFLTPGPGTASVAPAFNDWLTAESKQPSPKPSPVKPGTGAAPAVKPAPVVVPPKPVVPAAVLVPPAAPRPAPVRPAPRSDEVEVELVTMPPPAPAVQLPPPPPQVVYRDPPPRPLWQLDRRDLFMLGFGGLGVLAAVGLGYGLAKAVRRKPEPEAVE